MEAKELRLVIVPLDAVLLHEEIEQQRVDRLVERLEEDRVLKNPPIVTEARTPEGWSRYVVLDGASRTSALRVLKIPHILVQVVDYHSRDLRLESWHHLLVDVDPEELRHDFVSVPGVSLRALDEKSAREQLDLGELICYVVFADGQVTGVSAGSDYYAQNRALNAIVQNYEQKVNLYRVATTDVEELAAKHHKPGAVVVFPRYKPVDILRLAMNGAKVPMGITRHIIPGRALRINLPLEVLQSEQSLEEKNAWLDQWLTDKVQERHVRFYQEPVFLFDE